MSWHCDIADFATEDEAREHALENMDLQVSAEYFSYQVSYERLFDWCLKQPGFFDEWANEFTAAENAYFQENYWEEIEEEER